MNTIQQYPPTLEQDESTTSLEDYITYRTDWLVSKTRGATSIMPMKPIDLETLIPSAVLSVGGNISGRNNCRRYRCLVVSRFCRISASLWGSLSGIWLNGLSWALTKNKIRQQVHCRYHGLLFKAMNDIPQQKPYCDRRYNNLYWRSGHLKCYSPTLLDRQRPASHSKNSNALLFTPKPKLIPTAVYGSQTNGLVER